MMARSEVSSFLHHTTPGKMTFSTKHSLGNRKRWNVSNFCHCASREKTISSSTRVYRFSSSPHCRRDTQEYPASKKNMVILLCMHVTYTVGQRQIKDAVHCMDLH